MIEPDTEPTDLLMEFILSVLTPFLTAGAFTDASLARQAAHQAIAAYQAANRIQLVTAGQIVAFTLASLDSMRLSLPPDLPLPMKLKLRGSANALNRTAQKANAALDVQRRQANAQPELNPSEVLAALRTTQTELRQAKTQAPEPVRPPEPVQPPEPAPPAETTPADLAWADVMADVAVEFAAELDTLTPAERQVQLARISALSHIAGALGRGEGPSLKAELLGSTALKV